MPSFFIGRSLNSSSSTRIAWFRAPRLKNVSSRSRASIHRWARSTAFSTAALSLGFLGRAGTTTAPSVVRRGGATEQPGLERRVIQFRWRRPAQPSLRRPLQIQRNRAHADRAGLGYRPVGQPPLVLETHNLTNFRGLWSGLPTYADRALRVRAILYGGVLESATIRGWRRRSGSGTGNAPAWQSGGCGFESRQRLQVQTLARWLRSCSERAILRLRLIVGRRDVFEVRRLRVVDDEVAAADVARESAAYGAAAGRVPNPERFGCGDRPPVEPAILDAIVRH